VITYGTTRQAMIRAEDIEQEGPQTRFVVVRDGTALGKATVQMPGLHNVRNALAAVAVGLELDIPFEKIAAGLDRFSGVHRRFQHVGTVNDVVVIDDYAHHPTEIVATLEAASQGWPDRRIVAVFQPHLYSRTRDFKQAFARAFFNADVLVVTGIYGAREEPIEGIEGSIISDLAQRYGHRDTHNVPDIEALPDYLAGLLRPGDVVLMMGAGSIWRYARLLLEKLDGGQPSQSP
jgi:UDP-N-acetylmuramate--alanine ligase